MKRSLGAFLSLAMLAGSFLCLGMGMDMGTAYAQEPAHSCCPVQAPDEKESSAPSCCLLMPAAVSGALTVSPSLVSALLVSAVRVEAVSAAARPSFGSEGPPGRPAPGYASPASPRAPPAA
ncbi:MAG: hypothetical protein HY928_05040 [Elusimicrobia bacterium]|nr:hypothetical protein [Elusimicrobiota bacterium]